MSLSAPAGDPLNRPEKVTAFVSRAATEQKPAAAASDDLNAFSSEGPEPVAPIPARLAPGRRRRRVFAVVALLVAAAAAVAGAAVVMVPELFQLAPSAGPAERLARVTIDTTPLGADVAIDGQPRGLAPVTVQLAPGPHTVVLRRGQTVRTLGLQVDPGAELREHYEFAAEAAPPVLSTLSVTTEPPGARVLIDGEARGTSPLTVTDLPPARHRVTVIGETGSLERQVATEAGVAAAVVFSLPKAPPVAAGWLAVSAPFEVQVLERDQILGTSASSRFLVPAGVHDAELVNGTLGYSERRRIEISSGGTTTVRVDARASVSVNARPWAEVVVDGRPAGQTPIANLSLPLGTHQIVFRHPDLGERQQNVVVTAKGPNRIAVDLTR